MTRSATMAIGLMLVAGLLAGCGVRGSLEPPPSAQVENAGKPPNAPKEHRGFVLDGLIR
ncbi:MAG: lipoprotein [Pseudomonadota bacterium]